MSDLMMRAVSGKSKKEGTTVRIDESAEGEEWDVKM